MPPDSFRALARRRVEEWIKAMSRDGRFLAIMDRKRGYTIWDTVRSTPVATIGAKMRASSSAAFSPDGRTVALGLDGGKVGIWETRTGTQIKTLATGWKHVLDLAFSSDGKVLAASGDKQVLTWNWPGGGVRKRITGHTHTVYNLSLSSDGRVLASGSRDTTARVWDTKTGRELARFTGHRGFGVTTAITGDGRTLATAGGYQRFVRVFDIRSKRLIRRLNLKYPTRALAFAPDDRTLAIGMNFGGIRLRNPRTGRDVRTLKRRFLNAQKIMFLKGGKILVRISLGGKVTAVRTESDRVLVHILPVTGGGYAAYNPLGAVDGPEPFRNVFLTMVSSPKGRTAFGWQVGWDRFHVPGLITRAFKGR